MNSVFKAKCRLAVAIITLNVAGCSDSYLDLEDTRSISSEKFPASMEHVNILVSSVYGVQHDYGFLGWHWHGYGIFCLDHTIDFQWKNTENWIGISIGNAQAGDGKIAGQWRDISRGIYYANSALEGIENYKKTAPQTEFAALSHAEGEVLFLRGFYLWHLQTFYGQPELSGLGVPIIRSVPKNLAGMSVPRSTTRETYQTMIADFKKAADLLKGQTDSHRATEWSAKAALAKTYFFAEKTDSAKIYLEDCIQNSGKSLVSFDHYKKMFNGDAQYEYNAESFYEVGNSFDPNRTGVYNGSPESPGTAVSVLYAPFYIGAADERKSMGYSNLYMHDKNLLRFGYHDSAPLSQTEQLNGVWKLKDDYVAQQTDRRALAGQQADGPDPRLYVCALQPFFDKVKVAGTEYPVAQAEFGKWYTMDQATGNNPATFYGWSLKKNQYLDGTMAEIKQVSGVNFYFIRLADIYLMYAEILQESNPTQALEYINKVHRRAYGYPPDSPSPVDYASLTSPTKAPNGDHLSANPLLYERWAEFFGEAKWWEDVRRLRIGEEEAAYYKTVANGRVITWRNEHYAMPVPPTEFESNTHEGMVQNPGY